MRKINTVEVMGARTGETAARNTFSWGKLACALIDYGKDSMPGYLVRPVHDPSVSADAIVYCRTSDASLGAAVEHCQGTGVPLVLLSTGIAVPDVEEINFPLVEAPNSAVEAIRYIHEVEAFVAKHPEWEGSIVEHHQPTKIDTSGTAKKLAELVGIGQDKIESVRDWATSQEELGIEEKNKEGYAAHFTTFTNPDKPAQKESFDLIIQGREVYARGLHALLEAMRNPELVEHFAPGRIDFVELVRQGVV